MWLTFTLGVASRAHAEDEDERRGEEVGEQDEAAGEQDEAEGASPSTEGGDSVFVPIEDLATLSIPEDELTLAPDLLGLPIVRVDVRMEASRFVTPKAEVTRVSFGERLTPEVAREALREIAESSSFSDLRAYAERAGAGVVLRIDATPARRVAAIQIEGGTVERSAVLEAIEINPGSTVSERELSAVSSRIGALYARRGFPQANASVQAVQLDAPSDVLLVITVSPGEPRLVSQRVFVIDPSVDAHVGDLKFEYEVEANDRIDDSALDEADRKLAQLLRESAFTKARVTHRVKHVERWSYLYVYVDAGPKLLPRFEGNWAFDGVDLTQALELSKGQVSSAGDLTERVRRFYEARGFLDARVTAEERPTDDEAATHLVFTIIEGERARVERRVFACLPVAVDPDDLGGEIDRVLEERLPRRALLSVPPPRTSDMTFSTDGTTGARPAPLDLAPASVYTPDAYAAAVTRVREVLLARGYLNAAVGPLTLVRPRCKVSSGGVCVDEPVAVPRARCDTTPEGLPIPEDPLPRDLTCEPNSETGVRCSPRLIVHLPLHLGPVTTLWDVSFRGVKHAAASLLAEKTELVAGAPLNLAAVEDARRKLLAYYANRGYAYAKVVTHVDLSPDKSRAEVVFTIDEREVVTIEEIRVEGARQTDEALILRRLAFERGSNYSEEALRLSEERLATLGPFSSVSVTLADPEVVAQRKTVIVRVQEYPSQYLDPKVGFSTGEGIRLGLEYGHRNIASLGISLTLRIQLSYLFDFIILDTDVAENLRDLSASERLERRNSARLSFPDIGLGPLVSFGIEAVDVRDNQRDYGLTRDAVIPSLTFRPAREFVGTLAASVELNDEKIFSGQSVNDLIAKNRALEQLLRFPDGTTFAVAQRVAVSWDRRDNPLAATRGTLASADVEHVNAFPANPDDPDTDPLVSHFLRMSGRFTGYVRLTDGGAALAVSVAVGGNVQLQEDSKTYPDRLFYMGGSDSLRSFLSDSVVPEDVAQQILNPTDPDAQLAIEDVAIRGGDLWWNPRVEFRVPVTSLVGLGLFVEAGNLWVDPSAGFNPFDLRYGVGGGIRFTTPLGPVALDAGINPDPRPWEDVGAIHFAVGLL